MLYYWTYNRCLIPPCVRDGKLKFATLSTSTWKLLGMKTHSRKIALGPSLYDELLEKNSLDIELYEKARLIFMILAKCISPLDHSKVKTTTLTSISAPSACPKKH